MTRRSCIRIAPCLPAFVAVAQPRLEPAPPASRAASEIAYSLAGQRVPVWSRGALVIVEGGFEKAARDSALSAQAPRVRLFDRQGREILNAPITAPEASNVYISDWGRARDGSVAVCGVIILGDRNQRPFIARLSPRGQTRVTPVMPYTPLRIVAAEDNTVWTLGYETVNGAETGPLIKVDTNAGVLRRFDAAGKLVRSLFPRSGISDITRIRGSLLASSRDRVGWYGAGADGQGGYVEIANDGAVLNIPPVEPPAGYRVTGLTLTDANAVVVALSGADGTLRLHALDRRAKRWLPVSQPDSLAAAKGFRLWGADGDELALGRPERGKIALKFFTLAG